MQEVEAMCDRAFIIDRGKIVADNLDVKELAKGNERLEEIFKKMTSGE
jgi:ABC-type Na+ transport system ATPase subunit NatA